MKLENTMRADKEDRLDCGEQRGQDKPGQQRLVTVPQDSQRRSSLVRTQSCAET